MKPRHYKALGTVLIAAVLATFVLTTQKGKKAEDTTLIAIPDTELVRISVVWDKARDAEYERTNPLDPPAGESAPESAAPEDESESPAPQGDAESEATLEGAAVDEAEEVTRLVLVREDDPTDPTGSHWVFEEPLEGLRVDPSTVSGLVSRISFMQCERRIEGEDIDLATYGLDKPALTLTVESSRGDSTTLLVGRKHPNADWERFAKVEGTPGAVVIAASLVTDLTRNPEDLRDKRLFTLSTDDIKTVQVMRSHAPTGPTAAGTTGADAAATDSESSTAEESWDTESEEPSVASDSFSITFEEPRRADEDPKWTIEASVPLDGDASACRMFLSDLTNRRVERFHINHPTDADLVQCGLDRPSQTYVVSGLRKSADGKKRARQETTETLKIGNRTDDGHVYAVASWRPEILVMKDTDFEALQKTADDLRDKQLHDFDRSDIARIRTVRNGLQIELVPSKDDPDRWVLADGTDTEDFAASALVNMAAVLSATTFVDESPTSLEKYGLDTPTATMTIFPKKGDPVTVYFGGPVPGDPASVYARSSLSDAVVTVDSFRLNSIPDELSDIAALPRDDDVPMSVESGSTESQATSTGPESSP